MNIRRFVRVFGKFLYIYAGIALLLWFYAAATDINYKIGALDFYYIMFALGVSLFLSSEKEA